MYNDQKLVINFSEMNGATQIFEVKQHKPMTMIVQVYAFCVHLRGGSLLSSFAVRSCSLLMSCDVHIVLRMVIRLREIISTELFI